MPCHDKPQRLPLSGVEYNRLKSPNRQTFSAVHLARSVLSNVFEIPPSTEQRLGLDNECSWTMANDFTLFSAQVWICVRFPTILLDMPTAISPAHCKQYVREAIRHCIDTDAISARRRGT